MEKIRALVVQCRTNGEELTTILLTGEEETGLLTLTADEVGGEIAGALYRGGVRAAFSDRILGYKVEYDAGQFAGRLLDGNIRTLAPVRVGATIKGL